MAGADQLLLCRTMTMHTDRCLSHVAQPRVGDFESWALIGRNLATDHREYADQMSACLPVVSDHTERDHGWGFRKIRKLGALSGVVLLHLNLLNGSAVTHLARKSVIP